MNVRIIIDRTNNRRKYRGRVGVKIILSISFKLPKKHPLFYSSVRLISIIDNNFAFLHLQDENVEKNVLDDHENEKGANHCDLSSEDEAIANDLDMHSLILSGLSMDNEPVKTAEEVIREIDDIMEVIGYTLLWKFAAVLLYYLCCRIIMALFRFVYSWRLIFLMMGVGSKFVSSIFLFS